MNYWAERYLATEPQLQPLQPFTSEDIDFKGSSEDVQRIAQQLKLSPAYPPKVAMTALAGTIPFRIGDLKSNIEVVRRIPGVSGSVDALAIKAEWEGKTIRVLDPISLLACKLEFATVPQQKRRDVVHLKILVPCVRAFLSEVLPVFLVSWPRCAPTSRTLARRLPAAPRPCRSIPLARASCTWTQRVTHSEGSWCQNSLSNQHSPH